MKSICVVDTTLRDGEQSAGIVFSAEEKINIAKALDEAGIPVIEAGIPAMGHCEQEAITHILGLNLNAQIMTWNRALISDIRASLACGVKHVHISVPVSEIHITHKLRKNRAWVLRNLAESVSYARSCGLSVSVGAEDASRADLKFVIHVARQAELLGAVRFRYADTLGVLEPFKTYDIIKELKKTTGLAIEAHFHNDFGLAAANALSACLAGVQYVDTTVNGIGERAGNTSLQDLLKVFNYLFGHAMSISIGKVESLSVYVNEAVQKCFVSEAG